MWPNVPAKNGSGRRSTTPTTEPRACGCTSSTPVLDAEPPLERFRAGTFHLSSGFWQHLSQFHFARYLLGQPMTARFATATGLLVGASLTTAAAAVADPGDTVTYTVSSDGPLMSVSYYDEMDNMLEVKDQPANWSTTFTSEATSGLFAVDAQTRGEKVYCQIIINGQVRDQKSATGRNSLANCSVPIYATQAPPPT